MAEKNSTAERPRRVPSAFEKQARLRRQKEEAESRPSADEEKNTYRDGSSINECWNSRRF